MKTSRTMGMWLMAALASVSAQADVRTYNPTADTRMASAAPAGTEGTLDILSAYNVGGNQQNSVLQFDLSALPSWSTISSATLVLQRDSALWTGGDSGFATYVYRTTNWWVEPQVSWISRALSVPWVTSGGDYVGTTGIQDVSPYASNTLSLPNGSAGIFALSNNVTGLVSEWVSGTYPNYGLMVVGQAGNELVFHSREASTPALRPLLIVDFQVPEPSIAPLFLFGWLLVRRLVRQGA